MLFFTQFFYYYSWFAYFVGLVHAVCLVFLYHPVHGGSESGYRVDVRSSRSFVVLWVCRLQMHDFNVGFVVVIAGMERDIWGARLEGAWSRNIICHHHRLCCG